MAKICGLVFLPVTTITSIGVNVLLLLTKLVICTDLEVHVVSLRDSVTLQCKLHETPSDIFWTHEGKIIFYRKIPVNTALNGTLSLSENQSLHIESVNFIHQGRYACKEDDSFDLSRHLLDIRELRNLVHNGKLLWDSERISW